MHKFRTESTLVAPAADTVSLYLKAGTLSIRGEDRDDVEATIALSASREGELEAVRIDESTEEGHLTLSIDWDEPHEVDASVDVAVPEWLTVSDTTVVNGSVELREVTGALAIEVTNGSVEGQHLGGSLSASIVNGSIALEDVEEVRTIEIVNGSADIELRTLEATLDITLTNGEIDLGVADGLDADLRCSVGLGAIDIEPVGCAKRGINRVAAEERLGEGGTVIDLTVGVGSIVVHEAP